MTSEHHPTTSRITEALLPTTDEGERTTRLRPVRTPRAPVEAPPATAPRSAPARPMTAPSGAPAPVPGSPGPVAAPVSVPAPEGPTTASAPVAAAPVVSTAPPGPPPAAPVQPQHFPPHVHHHGPGALPPEVPVGATDLRPVRERSIRRTLAVAVCTVLGLGLVGGALVGVWLAAAEPTEPAEPVGYAEAKELWHEAPVDTLFPRTLAGRGDGPGGADRTWTRIVVAPDAACTPAVLASGLLATVEPLGCERVLRATYTDATASSVITVGLVFTRADVAAQGALGTDLTTRLGADVPPALSGPGTVAARFGPPQRAAWWLAAPADLPVVVTAVSGFADGRMVDGGPLLADLAMTARRTDAVSQAGLGHEAKGIAERLVGLLRTAATTAATTAAKENAR
ncbi:hypothetical protein ACFW2Y_09450 [Streptomyces sp. NPDC058877]|uniref:hypothetical protein n=1 Tax=unclassified Streptomyces TaxID=2593676 RepID=UPI0036CEA585